MTAFCIVNLEDIRDFGHGNGITAGDAIARVVRLWNTRTGRNAGIVEGNCTVTMDLRSKGRTILWNGAVKAGFTARTGRRCNMPEGGNAGTAMVSCIVRTDQP
jgi:hypothetical protein